MDFRSVSLNSLKYFCQLIDVFNDTTGKNIYKEIKDVGIEVSKKDLLLSNASLLDKLDPQKQSKTKFLIGISKFKELLNDIQLQSNIEINHLGIGYYTDNLKLEVLRLKKITNDLIYEENSGIGAKWLFTGNVDDPKTPMFELVIKQAKKPTLSSWTPHLQFDFDTTLKIEELEHLLSKHFGKNWIKWRMESPEWGTPLVMGRMYNVDGVKVYLGIGTSDRNRDWHRRIGLVKL